MPYEIDIFRVFIFDLQLKSMLLVKLNGISVKQINYTGQKDIQTKQSQNLRRQYMYSV